MASASPPGRPVILVAYWESSISVPSCVPEFSSMPLLSVASRMLFRICCMKIASNCLAVSLIAAFGSLTAAVFSASSDIALVAPVGTPDIGEAAMLR